MFVYTNGYKEGYNSVIELEDSGKDMMMDVGILRLRAGGSYTFEEAQKEVALMLLEGSVAFVCGENTYSAQRGNAFTDLPSGMLFCKGTKVTVNCLEDCDIYVQKSLNDRSYDAVFYPPESIMCNATGDGILDDTMHRKVRTMFDYDSAPFSNMVLGETVNKPGRWSGYIPHIHKQPEVYYYRFDHPQGFGAAFENDNVYKIKNDSLLMISSFAEHPQVTAPGYAMLTIWGIRHIDGDPWVRAASCVEPEEHKWMMQPDAKFTEVTR